MANIVIRDLDDQLVAQLKDLTGEKTNSKALIGAAEMALDLTKELFNERERADAWFERCQERHRVLEQLVPVMKAALELAGQGNLFNQENDQ